MRKIIIMFFVFSTVMIHGQEKLPKELIRQKNDSILAEGNLLYKYEKAAWTSTDLAMSIKEVKDNFGGYLIYQSGDSIKAIILGKKHQDCIYEMTFFHDMINPYKESLVGRKLSDEEEKLQAMKTTIMDKVLTPAYHVTCIEGYNLTIELIPYEAGYKLYILTGTSKHDIIPTGNDYIFFCDKTGEINSWRKFHSILIATKTKIEGQKVRSIIHSHLRAEVFITASDICTFRLYGAYYGLKQFKVLSTALSKTFTYDADKNTIEEEDI